MKNIETHLHIGKSPTSPLIVLNMFAKQDEEILSYLKGDCSLLAIMGMDWDDDLTPWECPRLSKGDKPCRGKADGYLAYLEEEIIPAAIRENALRPSEFGIAGYSLAGLFAIYAATKSPLFSLVASCSGSLWYPSFKEYLILHPLKPEVRRVYLSLGDKESHTRHTLLREVQTNTEFAFRLFESTGKDVKFELNEGNHFAESAKRTAKGIDYLLIK